MKKITVIGSGSWGTALAIMFDKYGHETTIWSWMEEEARRIKAEHEHREYLPGVNIRDSIKIVTDIGEAVEGAEIIINAVPSKFMRTSMERFVPYINKGQIIVNVSKGLEEGSLLRLSEVLESLYPENKIFTLSGPSHAEEVSRDIPTAVVIAGKDIECAKMLQNEFMNPNFRVYVSDDVLGVEIGAALKNVMALAAGMTDGLGFGDNTKAALMTRGMAEICRLGVAMGANIHTFSGLSGIGDLIVTCTSMHSRNRRAGILIGEGNSLSEAIEKVHMVVEGVNTAKAALDLSQKYNVDMPIVNAINKVLFENKNPREAVLTLMQREGRMEIQY